MITDFTPVSMEGMARYRALHEASHTKAADYSFTNLWGWAEHYGLEWRFTNDLCWIRQTSPKLRYWAPMGNWDKVDWANTPELASGMRYCRVPDALLALWQQSLPDRLDVCEARDQWDYLYSVKDLTTLSGNRFHKKKNLLNQFLKLYPEQQYVPMTLDCIEAVLKMQEEWCKWQECISEALQAENAAIFRVLSNWDRLPGLIGGAIHCHGKVVAYTVGEQISPDTLVVHFEKGTTEYKGIYQAINCFFVRAEGKDNLYINREQDVGDEGLRKAKQSYNPVDYVRKSSVGIL